MNLINNKVFKTNKCMYFKQIKKYSEKTFMHKDLKVFKSTRLNSVPPLDGNITFGYYVSDYMLEFDFEHGNWDRPVINPYHSLSIDPCNSTLHYGVELYEG